MKLDKITENLLNQISELHKIPNGAMSFRRNGKSEIKSTPNIEIKKKDDNSGIDIFIHSSCKNEACHIPVVITENGLFDLVYNDFYIEDGAEVTIVAGCGVHSDTESGHDGIHTFHVGKNVKITYVENHLATGKGSRKELNPTTVLNIGENSSFEMVTTQIGGVSYSSRKTKANLKSGASLVVKEKILTDKFEVAKTDFVVNLNGENSKCTISSKSVSRGESEQVFKSSLIGKNSCFGHVECDGIVFDNSKIDSVPRVCAKSSLASLSHEASIGKINADQIVKLLTLGLNEKQAEEKIVEGFLK